MSYPDPLPWLPPMNVPHDAYDREGRPQIKSFPSYLQELERFRRSIEDVAGRRFYACRRSGDMKSVIEALPVDEATKRELLNLNSVLLRMVILANDGGPLSPSTLNPF